MSRVSASATVVSEVRHGSSGCSLVIVTWSELTFPHIASLGWTLSIHAA